MSKIEVNAIEPQCGTTLTIGASDTSIAGIGTVNWDTTAKTAAFTAVSGRGYFVNTTSGAITVTLPAGSAGSIVSLKDYANTWDTNNVTLTPNGTDKINGTNASATLNTEDQSVTLVYVDSTKGWRAVQDSTSNVSGAAYVTATGGTVTTCGDYKIHTFTGPGTFCVSCAGNASGSNSVDYLVVAGGGSGGADGGAGGGAGGLRASATTYSIGCNPAGPLVACVSALPVTATGYPITVGGGGPAPGPGNGSPGCAPHGQNGSNSIFSTITSAGGGGGGGGGDNTPPDVPSGGSGNPGGSGGGGRGNCSPSNGTPGSGNTPPVSPPQGQNGGATGGCNSGGSGGGGGALAVGGNGSSGPSPGNAGAGGAGAGFTCGAFGSGNGECSSCVQYFSGGGAGGGLNACSQSGGLGGGGDNAPTNGSAGTTNTGGGGGGGRGNDAGGGAGGSGIVIIRYKYQ